MSTRKQQNTLQLTAIMKLAVIHGLTKLMVSHDLLRSTVTNQIAFDQRELHSTLEFERAMDRRCQALVSKLETLDTITFT